MSNGLIPKVAELLQNKGVYANIKEVLFEDYKGLYNQIDGIKSLDLYCPHCSVEKTFVYDSKKEIDNFGRHTEVKNQALYGYSDIIIIGFKCPTCEKKICFVLYYDGQKLIKIGQYPSLKDVDRNEINKYKKIKLIDEEYFEELKKAEVCASESYYVASFLYLRRVFENLITNIYKENQEEIGEERDSFNKMFLEDKLKLLKPFLAIEKDVCQSLYKLLSEGVHNLPEDQCEQNYELLKIILLGILEEQESKKRKKENLDKLHSLISHNKGGDRDEE